MDADFTSWTAGEELGNFDFDDFLKTLDAEAVAAFEAGAIHSPATDRLRDGAENGPSEHQLQLMIDSQKKKQLLMLRQEEDRRRMNCSTDSMGMPVIKLSDKVAKAKL